MTRYRTATLPELRKVLDWAAAEGWNPGVSDADAFYAADPDGFFVAVENGAPIAAISVVNHNDRFAFLGFYIVQPEYRGRGIGLGLWRHALAHAGGRVVGLDGVEAQQDNYAQSGFAYAGGTTRYEGIVSGRHSDRVRLATPQDMDVLVDMEAAASGSRKPAYLIAWFAPSDQRKTLVVAEHGQITGACTVRQCRAGAKIGPLIAADQAAARALIEQAATVFDGPVILDVPSTSSVLTELCEAFGLEPGFQTARMYLGSFTPVAHDIFAVASLELG